MRDRNRSTRRVGCYPDRCHLAMESYERLAALTRFRLAPMAAALRRHDRYIEGAPGWTRLISFAAISFRSLAAGYHGGDEIFTMCE